MPRTSTGPSSGRPRGLHALVLSAAAAAALAPSPGCTINFQAQPAQSAPAPAAGPVVDGPGVALIQVEPPPAERVYVYDPGYPPGTYLYGGYYYYGDYYYPRTVFVDRYVVENVRAGRYADAAANRRDGRAMEAQQRAAYAHTGGRRPAGPDARRPPAPPPPAKKKAT